MAAMMLSACNEDFGDWVIPAGNEQAAIHSFGDGSVSAADPIMFADLAEDVAAVKVANITAPKADSVFATSYQIQLGKDLHELMADGMMSRTELENYVLATFGPRPVERELTANVIATVSNGKTATRYTNPLTIKATPKAPFIDAAYYLAGDMTGWDAESAVAFAHSGKDVYEDPVFTIVVKTTEANQYWKIIPKTNYDGEFWAEGEKGVVGVANDGDDAPSGSLTTNNPGAGKIANVGYHKITINMMEYTYTVEDLNFAKSMRWATIPAGTTTPTPCTAPISTACITVRSISTAISNSSPTVVATGTATGNTTERASSRQTAARTSLPLRRASTS